MKPRILLTSCVIALSGCAASSPFSSSTPACPEIPSAGEKPSTPLMPESFKSSFPIGTYTRTDAEINQVFYQARGAFNAIYSRAWNQNPCITAGTSYFAIALAPNGTVGGVQMVSSQINDPAVVQKISERIALLKFPSVDREGFYVFLYPIRIYPVLN